jgi:hypothetical protein
MNIAADKSAISAAQGTLSTNAQKEVALVFQHATPNAYIVQDQHLHDQVTVDLDDLAIQERQKQLDLVTNVYGESGPASDLTDSQAKLAGLQEQKTSDQNLP